MTTQAITIEGGVGRSESRLEVLVDRVIEALFRVQQEERASAGTDGGEERPRSPAVAEGHGPG